ncbi:calcium-binding protein [Enterovibrio norvegicus]|uniref:Alkaline phosphatase n=1 Tax=Enterovibrio norvegicus TaxID=188144 RepID=A0ABV4L4B2_9GAMM
MNINDQNLSEPNSLSLTLDELQNDAVNTALSPRVLSDIVGTNGNDTLHGDENDNRIYGLDYNDTLYGYGGDDTLYGGSRSDTLYGGDGDDKLYGMTDTTPTGPYYGLNRLYGERGNDELYGSLGVDYLYGGLHNDTLYGDQGNDRLYGEQGHDALYGGEGMDRLYGDGGNDSLYGEDGIDQLYGGAGDDFLSGGEGNDEISGDAGNDQLEGGSGDDELTGGAGNDILDGGAGDDTLVANAGNDTLYGGEGHDYIYGNEGDDTLHGQDGDDMLIGDQGDDTLFAGSGNNTLDGGSGYDRAYGASGDDTIIDSELAIGAGGKDIIFANAHTADVAIGGAGTDWVEGYGDDQVGGGSGNDVLVSFGKNDTLRGGTGDDVLLVEGSTASNSRLFGGAGDDYLSGNGEDQLLIGGSGADIFHFGHSILRSEDNIPKDAPSIGHDRIVDFEVGIDTISIDTSLANSIDDLNIEQHGITTRITLSDGSTIILNKVQAADLSASDFAFTRANTYSDKLGDWQSYADSYWGFSTRAQPDQYWHNDTNNIKKIGNNDNNVLEGSSRTAEYYDGGAGNDTLTSRGGNDNLVGGEGKDAFELQQEIRFPSTDTSTDIQTVQIEDFTVGTDTLAITFNSYNLSGFDLSALTANQVGSAAVVELNEYFHVVLKNVDASSFESEHVSYVIHGNSGNETLIGDDADNTISGEKGNDIIKGDGGDDTLDGGAGNDTVSGGSGNDQLWGGGGSDTLFGDEGNDELYAEGGNDQLDAGAGDDLLVADIGNNTLTGGAGKDTFSAGDYEEYGTQNNRYNNTVTDFDADEDSINIAHVIDDASLFHLDDSGVYRAGTLLAQNENDVVMQFSSSASFTLQNVDLDDISGEQFNFTLVGRNNANHIVGWNGNDTLIGRNGNDTLEGGNGADRLEGGVGFDTLTGGEGADTFVVDDDRSNYSVIETDTITDFVIGEDKIAFDDYYHADMDFDDFVVTQQGDDTLVQIIREYTSGGNQYSDADVNVLLKGIDAADISANDFAFFYSG